MKNIVNVFHEAKFADGDWPQLGLQLINLASLTVIDANYYGDSWHCMINTIYQWLKMDCEASWEKLAEAVAKVRGYGEATADIVRQNAGIVQTGIAL